MADNMEELSEIIDVIKTAKVCSEITDQIVDACIGSVDAFVKKVPELASARDRLIVAAAVRFTYQIVLDSLSSDTDNEDECDGECSEGEDECDGQCDECEQKCDQDCEEEKKHISEMIEKLITGNQMLNEMVSENKKSEPSPADVLRELLK